MILLYGLIGAIILFILLYLYSTTLRSRHSTKGVLEKSDPQDRVVMFSPERYHGGKTGPSDNKWVALGGKDLGTIYDDDD